MLGLMILYHRYVISTSHLELAQLPVRQNGCVNEALRVKYVSIVSCCIDGGDCVRRWMTPEISLTVRQGQYMNMTKVMHGDAPGFSILKC
jgi:hypothetical protein